MALLLSLVLLLASAGAADAAEFSPGNYIGHGVFPKKCGLDHAGTEICGGGGIALTVQVRRSRDGVRAKVLAFRGKLDCSWAYPDIKTLPTTVGTSNAFYPPTARRSQPVRSGRFSWHASRVAKLTGVPAREDLNLSGRFQSGSIRAKFTYQVGPKCKQTAKFRLRRPQPARRYDAWDGISVLSEATEVHLEIRRWLGKGVRKRWEFRGDFSASCLGEPIYDGIAVGATKDIRVGSRSLSGRITLGNAPGNPPPNKGTIAVAARRVGDPIRSSKFRAKLTYDVGPVGPCAGPYQGVERMVLTHFGPLTEPGGGGGGGGGPGPR